MDTETLQILETVKKLLKSSSMLYEDLAEELGISLASVKRILNGKDIQISKLIKIAKILGFDFFELVDQAKKTNYSKTKLTLDQEILLSKDFNNFLIFRLIIIGKKRSEILKSLSLNEKEISIALKNLEKVGLVEVFPNNILKTKVTFPLKWIEDGPLEKTYNDRILQKLTNEVRKVGINKSFSKNNSTQVIVKEFLLEETEVQAIKNDLRELLKKYQTVTKLRLKSNDSPVVVAFSSVIGEFSWWE